MQRQASPSEPLRWDDVRLFLALCRARTVGEAGRALGVDSSTVSRRLTALEEALTASLFDRNHEGISATKAAEDLLPMAEEMEEAMLRFAHAADGLEREVSGLVRIACPPDVANVVIAPLLRELFTLHPALRVEIAPGEAVIDLTRREADLALRTVRPAQGDLLVTRLTSVRWVLVASSELARELGSLRSWSDAPWIGWGLRLSMIGPAQWLERHAKGVDPVVRSDSLMVQIAAVSAGVGVSLGARTERAALWPRAREARGQFARRRSELAHGRAVPGHPARAARRAARARPLGSLAATGGRTRRALNDESPRPVARSCRRLGAAQRLPSAVRDRRSPRAGHLSVVPRGCER